MSRKVKKTGRPKVPKAQHRATMHVSISPEVKAAVDDAKTVTETRSRACERVLRAGLKALKINVKTGG